MAKWIGRRADTGIGKEATRGTSVAPTFWLPRTSISFEDRSTKIDSFESLGTIEDAHESFNMERFADGEIQGEIRDDSFGLLLLATLGSVGSVATDGAAYTHSFTVANSNQHQSITIQAQDPSDNIRFPLAMINTLTVNANLGEIAQYTAGFESKGSDDVTAGTPSYSDANKFPTTFASVKIAANTGALDAASATSIKNVTFTISKNLVRDHVLGTIEPEDIENQQFMCEGAVTLNFENQTFMDYQLNNTYRALRIDFTRTDVTIGSSSNPRFRIEFPRVNFRDWSTDRANDTIASQTVSFKALRDNANSASMISACQLVNTETSY